MQIQLLINGFFRQNFRDPIVLGRTLFGLGIFVIGWANILSIETYASVAPAYIPFASLAVIAVASIFIVFGFLIAANRFIITSTTVLMVVFASFAVFVYLPMGSILPLIEQLILIGAALVLKETSKLQEKLDDKNE